MESQQIQLSLQKNEQDRQNTAQLLQEKEQKQALYDLEQSQLLEQCQSATEEIEQFQKTVERSEQKMTEINQKLAVFQNSMTEEKQQRDEILNSITELKVNISAEEQNKKQ